MKTIEDFMELFVEQFDDIDASKLNSSTNYRALDEWSSLVALSVLAMIDEEFDVQLKGEEMRKTSTIQELFDLVNSKLG